VRRLTSKSPITPSHDPSSAINHESNRSSRTLIDSLAEGKFALHKILKESSVTTDKLEAEIFRLNSEITILQSSCQAERETAEHDRIQQAELQVALDKLRADDDTAAKMVSRYMSVFCMIHYDCLLI
jgi:TolA-binding protein